MAAPTVTRPLHTDAQQDSPLPVSREAALQWAKWGVIGVLVAGVVSLVLVSVITLNERSRVNSLKAKWDALFLAVKDKTKIEDRIPALEQVMPALKGTPVHAYALLELGDLYFHEAVKTGSYPEERGPALEKAIALYKLVATQQPYSTNPAFGPLAVHNLALAYEQARDYDAAIKLLSVEIENKTISQHYLQQRLLAQLGRLYYVRGLQKQDAGQDAKEDLELARKNIEEALIASGAGKDDEESRGMRQSSYVSSLEYLRSLLEKRGKALPEGAAVPPLKIEPQPETELKEPAPALEPKKDEAATREAKPDAGTEPKKEDAKPEAPKPEAPKADAAKPGTKN